MAPGHAGHGAQRLPTQVVTDAAGFLVYLGVRAVTVGERAVAIRHGHDVLRVERSLGLYVELLGDELGVQALPTLLADARRVYPTRERLLEAVGTVRRRDARELIRTLLIDLATADGDRGDEENALLSEVTRVWARG